MVGASAEATGAAMRGAAHLPSRFGFFLLYKMRIPQTQKYDLPLSTGSYHFYMKGCCSQEVVIEVMPRGDFRDFENVAAQSRGWIYDLGCEEQDSERSMCELTESRSLIGLGTHVRGLVTRNFRRARHVCSCLISITIASTWLM